MMLVVFLQMQDLRSQLQEMIPEQQVCYWIPIYKSCKVEKSLWYLIPFTIQILITSILLLHANLYKEVS
jgi:hypothetical protein